MPTSFIGIYDDTDQELGKDYFRKKCEVFFNFVQATLSEMKRANEMTQTMGILGGVVINAGYIATSSPKCTFNKLMWKLGEITDTSLTKFNMIFIYCGHGFNDSSSSLPSFYGHNREVISMKKILDAFTKPQIAPGLCGVAFEVRFGMVIFDCCNVQRHRIRKRMVEWELVPKTVSSCGGGDFRRQMSNMMFLMSESVGVIGMHSARKGDFGSSGMDYLNKITEILGERVDDKATVDEGAMTRYFREKFMFTYDVNLRVELRSRCKITTGCVVQRGTEYGQKSYQPRHYDEKGDFLCKLGGSSLVFRMKKPVTFTSSLYDRSSSGGGCRVIRLYLPRFVLSFSDTTRSSQVIEEYEKVFGERCGGAFYGDKITVCDTRDSNKTYQIYGSQYSEGLDRKTLNEVGLRKGRAYRFVTCW